MKILISFLFFILTSNFAFAIDICESAKEEIIKNFNGEIDSADINETLNFDCNEMFLINDIELPFNDSIHGFDLFINIVDKIPLKFLQESIDILQPYCRQDNSWFGTFCMAADTSSANLMSERKDLMALLPKAILMLSAEIDKGKKFDILKVLRPLFGDDQQSIRDWVFLSSFIGLDNNGVQTSRLLSNLLYKADIDNYAKLFPVFFQLGNLPAGPDGVDYTGHFAKVLYSTRAGMATIDGLDPDQTKTFKAYAGVYFGCQMAIKGYRKRATALEGYLMGYSYEIIKIAKFLGLSIREIFDGIKLHHNKGKNTGFMMKKGTRLGHQLCQ